MNCKYCASVDVEMGFTLENLSTTLEQRLIDAKGTRKRGISHSEPSASIVVHTPIKVEVKLKKMYDEEILTIELEASKKLDVGKRLFDRSIFGLVHHNGSGSEYIALEKPV